MADFNEPRNDTLAALVLDKLKAQILSVAKLFIGTTDSNVPDGVVRYNESAKKFEKKNGASYENLNFHAVIDDHIADQEIHGAWNPGNIKMHAGGTLETGWFWCHGAAVSRTDYANLFAEIGTTWGVGDGSTTFNLPDLRERTPLGRNTTGSYQTLGQVGGSMSHSHTTPNHQHTTATHRHDLANHTHSTPAHQHTSPTHEHYIAGHGHSTQHGSATIAIAASDGAHQHNINRRQNGGGDTSDNRVAMPASSGAEDYKLTRNDTQGNHGHNHASFTGIVGNAGVNGDNNIATTGGSALTTTAGEGGGTSGVPSSNYSGYSGALTTNSGEGGSTTGSANHPYAIVNFIIKY